MQKPQKAHAKAKAKCQRGFRLVGNGAVVEFELFKRVSQVLKFVRVYGVKSRKNKGFCLFKARALLAYRACGAEPLLCASLCDLWALAKRQLCADLFICFCLYFGCRWAWDSGFKLFKYYATSHVCDLFFHFDFNFTQRTFHFDKINAFVGAVSYDF